MRAPGYIQVSGPGTRDSEHKVQKPEIMKEEEIAADDCTWAAELEYTGDGGVRRSCLTNQVYHLGLTPEGVELELSNFKNYGNRS